MIPELAERPHLIERTRHEIILTPLAPIAFAAVDSADWFERIWKQTPAPKRAT